MKRILLVFTGGTFSSSTDKNVMDVSTSANEQFLNIINKKYRDEVEFVVINSLFMLSENMYPEVWSKITADINQNIQSTHDGIILIHGSDTVAYTANFLSYYYKSLKIPFLVTAANAPIDEDHSNGLNNFFACVRMIIEKSIVGTYFIYQNHGNKGDVIIYEPSELLEASIYTDDFISTNEETFGVVLKDEIVYHRVKVACGYVDNFGGGFWEKMVNTFCLS